jgi:hypothetical protein
VPAGRAGYTGSGRPDLRFLTAAYFVSGFFAGGACFGTVGTA